MADPATLLAIIWHSRTGTAQAMAEAAANGAGKGAELIRARDAKAGQLLQFRGYLFACPENLASISGEMKEMFDCNYYPLLGQIEGRAYATIIAAGSDGEGAQRQVDRIATGWRLRRVADPIVHNTNAQSTETILAPKIVPPSRLEECSELGAAMASALQQGIF